MGLGTGWWKTEAVTDSYWTPFCIFLNLEPRVRSADSKGEKPVPTKPGGKAGAGGKGLPGNRDAWRIRLGRCSLGKEGQRL